MSNTWMASKGLQVDFEDSVETPIKVMYGELEGIFQSMDSKNQKLTFTTSNIQLALDYIKHQPETVSIVYLGFVHTFPWKNHNYSLKKSGQFSLLVQLEENNVE